MTNVCRASDLDDFVSNGSVKETIVFSIAASKKQSKPFPHTIITGAPGTGKTTLAQIIAHEMGVKIRILMGPSVKESRDISNIFVSRTDDPISDGDIIFIDEVHSIKKQFQEMLYSAMEDRFVPVNVDGQTFNYKIKNLTVIIATNESSNLPQPLTDRCQVKINLDRYSVESLTTIIKINASKMNQVEKTKITIEDDAAVMLAGVCRGTPRISINNFKLIRDYAISVGEDIIDTSVVKYGLQAIGVDEYGLRSIDKQVLKILFEVRKMSRDSLASMIGYHPDILEREIEPYLMIQGLIMRSSGGRTITQKGWTMVADGLLDD